MQFHAESSCSWRSRCGRYQIVHHRDDSSLGFGIEVFRVNVDGERKHDALTLFKAQEWVAKDAHVPETDHVGWDGNGSPAR